MPICATLHLGHPEMPDWKDTLNLPRTGFPMKASLQTDGARSHRTVGIGPGCTSRIRERTGRCTALCPARRTALREWADPPGNGAEQDPQGLHHQGSHNGRVRCALYTGVGLSRTPDRAPGRPRAWQEEARHERRRLQTGVPTVRGEVCRADADRFQASRHPGPVGRAVSDDEFHLSGGDRPRARDAGEQRDGLQGQEARALVHQMPYRPGRS